MKKRSVVGTHLSFSPQGVRVTSKRGEAVRRGYLTPLPGPGVVDRGLHLPPRIEITLLNSVLLQEMRPLQGGGAMREGRTGEGECPFMSVWRKACLSVNPTHAPNILPAFASAVRDGDDGDDDGGDGDGCKGLVRIAHRDLQRRQLQAQVSRRAERVGRSLRSHERKGGQSSPALPISHSPIYVAHKCARMCRD